MKKTLITFAALATILTGFSLPATAASTNELSVQVHSSRNDHGRYDQRHGWKKQQNKRHQMMKPGEVKKMLHRQGYRAQDIRQQRGEYFVRARTQKGRQVMLVINGYNGKIINQRSVSRPHINRT